MEHAHPNRRCVRAFTLIEVLVVVVVLGILAAIVVPKFAKASDDPTYQVAKNFEHLLETGRVQMSLMGSAYVDKGEMPVKLEHFVLLKPDPHPAGDTDPAHRNTVHVDRSIRKLLSSPDGNVYDYGTNTITLSFKTGLVATYTIANDKLVATYTGAGAP